MAHTVMRICIPIRVKPQGGGNDFVVNFIKYLESKGIAYTTHISDRYDVLFTSHWLVGYDEILCGIRHNPLVRLVHRINGAAQDYGRHPSADRIQHKINLIADLTIFQSYYCRYSTREKYPVVVHDGPVIYNAVDVTQFRPDGERIDLPGVVKVCTVTWSTNLLKGAQSIYAVARANPGVEFVLCGRYADAPSLPNVHMMGVLGRDDLARVMRSCDILLTFSENEACPNVVLEGLASGLPILYKHSGATPEVVGDCGLPVEVDNFPKQLDRIMTNREALSIRARERALTHFHPEIVFARYLSEIEQALERKITVPIRRRYLLALNPIYLARPLFKRILASLMGNG